MSYSPTATALKRDLYCMLEPPPDLRLSQWAEEYIVMPEGSRARPGGYRNWPYMVEILDAMADPAVDRVTIMKSARIGYTNLTCLAMSPSTLGRAKKVKGDMRLVNVAVDVAKTSVLDFIAREP